MEIRAMARVASCPQCSHELYVPGESDGESWVKCPDCSASFQVKQAALRELPMALLVESPEQPTVDFFAQDAEQPTLLAQDDVETAVAAHPVVVDEVASTEVEDGKVDRLVAAPNASWAETPTGPSDAIGILGPAPKTVDHGIVAEQDDTPALDELVPAAKKGDDLEAAAQRIDEWFRSAKTVPDAPPVDNEDEAPAVEEIPGNLSTAGPIRTNATIDMDATDAGDLAAMTDFDLDEPQDRSITTTVPGDDPAWGDSNEMKDLLGEPEAGQENEFVAEFAEADESDTLGPDFAHDEDTMDNDPSTSRDEQPAINFFSDSDRPEEGSTKSRGRRRDRSFASSLILIVVAGLIGLSGGYYALLWLRGPSMDFLSVAQYLPTAILPGSFAEPTRVVRSAPPANAAETMAAAEPATNEESTEPQALPPAADESAQPLSDIAVATKAAPADASDQSAEVQASYAEGAPGTDAAAPAAVGGDRYATTTNETEAEPDNAPTATGVTSEKPATTDLSVDDLAPAESPATQTTGEPAALEPISPATAEPEVTELTGSKPAGNKPTALDALPTDPLSDITSASESDDSVTVKITNAPAFTANDLQASLEAAAKAQPQLVAGNFADSKEVAQAKGRSYAILADLAQKAVFVDVSEQSTRPIVQQVDELFHKTLADPHTRGEVAQILPRWIQSPNRKHGGVFFAGRVVNHANAGSVTEYTVELDGGRTLKVLAPALAAEQLQPKTMAIVGWLVETPQSQVSGYTGGLKSPAIWATKLLPLE